MNRRFAGKCTGGRASKVFVKGARELPPMKKVLVGMRQSPQTPILVLPLIAALQTIRWESHEELENRGHSQLTGSISLSQVQHG